MIAKGVTKNKKRGPNRPRILFYETNITKADRFVSSEI
jgi:hypothetical protein